MLTGKRFRLNKDSLVIANSDHRTVTIPAGQIVRVTSGPRPDDQRMVDITWKGSPFFMFAEDIERRAARRSPRKAASITPVVPEAPRLTTHCKKTHRTDVR